MRRCLRLLIVLFVCGAPQRATALPPQLELGAKPSLGLFQPRVTVDIASADGGLSFGPDASTFLLDTAANGVVIFPPATEQVVANGFRNEGTYEEVGVSGTSVFDVSAPYHLTYEGTDGNPQSMSDVRFMSASQPVDPTGIMGLNGIVGISSMVGKVTSLDNRTREGAPTLGMGVSFSEQIPTAATHRFTIPFESVEFPLEGESEPFPTWFEGLPTVEIQAVNGDVATSNPIVFDTGAQITIISEAMAHGLGLDANGNGDFADEAIASVPISGATGSVQAPILTVDRMSLATDQGFQLSWTSADVIVLDIHPRINGVLGADFITGDGGLDVSILGGTGGGLDLGSLLGAGGLEDLLGGGLGDVFGLGGLGGGLGDLFGGLGDILGGGGLDDLLGGGLGGLDGLLGGSDLSGLGGLFGGGDLGGLFGGLDLGGLLGGEDLFSAFPLESYFDQVHIDLRSFEDGDGQLVLDVNPAISSTILNGDHVFDVRDIDELTDVIGTETIAFDLDGDGLVTLEDRTSLVHDVFRTRLGDADLDGDVDFDDFVELTVGFGESGGWGEGDFDGNGVTDFDDFVALSQNFGASSASTQSVPEPESCILMFWAAVVMVASRRRELGQRSPG